MKIKYNKLPFLLLPLHWHKRRCFLRAQGKSLIPFSGCTFPWEWHTFPIAPGYLSMAHPRVQHGSLCLNYPLSATALGLSTATTQFPQLLCSTGLFPTSQWISDQRKGTELPAPQRSSHSPYKTTAPGAQVPWNPSAPVPRAEEEIHSQGSCVLGSLLSQCRRKPSISQLCWRTKADRFSFCQKPLGPSGMRAAGQVSVETERNHQVSREDGRERRRGIIVVEKREGVGREKCYKSTMTTEQGDGKVSSFQ